MLEELQKMIKESRKAKEWINETKEQIRIVSHYDADGICSAAIMVKTLMREGKDFHLTLVKQLSEKILEDLAKEERKLIVFLDMGSGQLDLINKHLSSRVIICDHHQPQGEANESVVHINSIAIGIENNISGSGVTYILSRTIDPKNVDLSQLAIIGAIGDSQIDSIGKDWGVSGLNKEILKDAESKNVIKVKKGLRLWGRYTRPLHKAIEYSIDPYIPGISGSESASIQFLQETGIPVKKDDGEWRTIADLSPEEEKKLATGIIKERIRGDHEDPEYIFGDVYELLDKQGEFRDANEFATMLNACGKTQKGYLGVSLCLNGENAFEKIRKVLEDYRREIGKGISWINSNLGNKEKVKTMGGVYILAGPSISEHVISNVISTVNHSGMLPEKPVFGFADAEDGIKVSARASKSLVDSGINLKEILGSVAEKLGGQGGGHSGAAGATIPEGKQDEFINMTELILTNKNSESEKQVSDNGLKKEEEHGNEEQAQTERREGSDQGLSAPREGGDPGRKGRKGPREKMERKGLVQYFSSG